MWIFFNLATTFSHIQLKVQSAAEGDTYNKLDDTSLLGDSLTSQPGDFKTLLAKQQQQEEENESSDRKPEVSEASDSDRESIKRSEKSWDSDRAGVGSGANRVFGASCSGKSDSDRESGKKSSKSSPEAEKKSSEKKKKVKTHRRVSSASALSALGKYIRTSLCLKTPFPARTRMFFNSAHDIV